MTILFQDENKEILFETKDSTILLIIPNVGELVNIEDKWYKVVKRVYRYKHLDYMDGTYYVTVKRMIKPQKGKYENNNS